MQVFSRLIYNIVFKNPLQVHNSMSNSLKPINLCSKMNRLLIGLPLTFFPIKNSQPLFSAALTEARQEPVLFQNEVMCICALTVTVLSRNSFKPLKFFH